MQCEVGSIRFLMEAVVVGGSNIDTLMRKVKMGIDLDGNRAFKAFSPMSCGSNKSV